MHFFPLSPVFTQPFQVVVVGIVEAVLPHVNAVVQSVETPSLACHEYHHSSSKKCVFRQQEERV
jgi:hypothetical protein